MVHSKDFLSSIRSLVWMVSFMTERKDGDLIVRPNRLIYYMMIWTKGPNCGGANTPRMVSDSCWFVLVRVTHKYGGIIFFETIGEKKNKKFYVDCGADDYEWTECDASRYSLPKHRFYPIMVVVPSWVDMSDWCAPKKMIVKIKD